MTNRANECSRPGEVAESIHVGEVGDLLGCPDLPGLQGPVLQVLRQAVSYVQGGPLSRP